VQTPTKGPQDHVPAAPKAAKPPRREEDLIVIPEAKEPPRWGLIAAVAAGALALILIVALTAYAIDQRNRADDLDAQLTQAIDDQQALVDAATASRERVAVLETRVGSLEGDLQRARRGKDVAAASRKEARRDLRQARQALEEEQARFRSYMGPEVGDGTYVGRLIAVGADQTPARVTIDLGRWFTGAAATQAAFEDGVIGAHETVRRYFRNDDTAWRTLPLDSFATVTVLRSGGGGTFAIPLAELQRLSRADSRRADRLSHDPFRITVVGGRITALRELRYP
jgi:hypothetical protein